MPARSDGILKRKPGVSRETGEAGVRSHGSRFMGKQRLMYTFVYELSTTIGSGAGSASFPAVSSTTCEANAGLKQDSAFY
jgi:hypothetical protein